MPTSNWTAFQDDVLPHAPGCDWPMAQDAVRKAAIDFCEQTRVWHFEHPLVNVVANTADYPFVPPAGTVVHEILDAWFDNVWIEPQGSDDLSEINGSWLTWTGPRAIYITQPDERTARLVPKPTANLTNGLRMLVALKPTIASTGIETRLYEEYREIIACGALARLYKSPKKPYTDFALGENRNAQFRRDCTRIFNRAARANTRGVDHEV